MSDDRLEQQIAHLVMQQAKHDNDLARIKEQLDSLTAVVIDLSERFEQGSGRAVEPAGDIDEETVEELAEGINQVANNVDNVADVMLHLANIAQEHHKHIDILLQHDTQLAERIVYVCDRLKNLYEMLTDTFNIQTQMSEDQQSRIESETALAAALLKVLPKVLPGDKDS